MDETCKIAKDRREGKFKSDRNIIRSLNVVFQPLAWRDKENYYNKQHKKQENNNKRENKRSVPHDPRNQWEIYSTVNHDVSSTWNYFNGKEQNKEKMGTKQKI